MIKGGIDEQFHKARQGKARQGAVGSACVIASVCSAAGAQSSIPHQFAESRIIVGDWTFVPIYYEDASQDQVVDGLFAYADELSRTGSNLSAVWYDKRADGWYASSWETVDLQEAIKSVVIEENIQNRLWEDFVGSPFEGVPESPKGFANGVLVGDPAEAAVSNSADPLPIVDFLVTVGYAAADVPVIGDQGCNKEAILSDLAVLAREFITAGDLAIASLPVELCAARPRGTRPTPPTPVPATAPAWSTIPRDGPLPGTGWTPGPWPTTGTPAQPAWYCFASAGGSSCFCSRERWHGRYETRGGRVRWHLVLERESCNTVGATACPSGGPPPAGNSCDSTFTDWGPS